MTALVAGYAVALCAVVAAFTGTIRTATEGYRIGMVAVAGALAVLAAVIRSRREGALIEINERVQHAILRPLPAELGGVAFASHYQSATTAALVGGDLYDVAMTQFGPRFIIGDVKGKGLDAVGRCAAVLAVFRELAFGEPDLIELAEKMDARLSRDMEIEDFVTVILADFAPGEVRIVNCGHHPPVKLSAGAADCRSWPRTSPRRRSACTRARPGRTSTCSPATGCCSPPTAWSRPGTAPAASSTWTITWPRP